MLAMLKKQDDDPIGDIMVGITALFTSGIGFAFALLYFFLPLGWVYWIWLSIQMESFAMFALGIFPPTGVIAAPIGLYSLVFDPPDWLITQFASP